MLRWSVAEVARVGAGDGLRQGFGDSDEALDRARTGSVENTLFPWRSGKRFRSRVRTSSAGVSTPAGFCAAGPPHGLHQAARAKNNDR